MWVHYVWKLCPSLKVKTTDRKNHNLRGLATVSVGRMPYCLTLIFTQNDRVVVSILRVSTVPWRVNNLLRKG